MILLRPLAAPLVFLNQQFFLSRENKAPGKNKTEREKKKKKKQNKKNWQSFSLVIPLLHSLRLHTQFL